jgi:Xaa-Pro aminopeptidase
MSQERIQQLRTWIAEQGIDAFLVTQPQNRSYLSGWLDDDAEGSGLLLVSQHQQVLLTNPLYKEIAEKEASDWQIIIPQDRKYPSAIAELAQTYGWKKIGFESKAITYWEYEQICHAGQHEHEPLYTLTPFEQSYVDTLRLVKQPYELELLRKAIAITDETFAHICDWISAGMTEREVEWEIVRFMVARGADGPAFATIVASGPHSSMPHARPTERRIGSGEFITIDMGARYKGYCADMTRTICIGEPREPRMQEVYDAVLRAMKACEQGMHAGMTAIEADALARQPLEKAGLGEYYVHGTGHGVGLQIHEAPRLSPHAPQDIRLPVGCVVTVEPGVYIPDWGGVRIEDGVLVKEDGVEVVTQSPTKLVIPC